MIRRKMSQVPVHAFRNGDLLRTVEFFEGLYSFHTIKLQNLPFPRSTVVPDELPGALFGPVILLRKSDETHMAAVLRCFQVEVRVGGSRVEGVAAFPEEGIVEGVDEERRDGDALQVKYGAGLPPVV